MSKPFSVILPIHNEAEMLPLSLPSIFALEPDEVIFLFDNCTDDSVKVAVQTLAHVPPPCMCRLEVPPESPEWSCRIAFLRRYGADNASNDLVLFTAADLVLDPKIKQYLELLGKDGVQLLSFMHKDYPIDWRNLMKRLLISTKLRGLGSERWLAGVMFYNHQLTKSLESIDYLKSLESGEDSHLHAAICSMYRSKCIVTETLHLRPRGTSQDYLCGGLYWSVNRRSLAVTLCSTLFLLRLDLWRGYVHARYGSCQNG